jgi:hypothetical protein
LTRESAVATISRLSAPEKGVFRGHRAVGLGVTRNQLTALSRAGVIERVLPDVYRMTAVAPSNAQSLRAALLWGGPDAAAFASSAAQVYGLEGVRACIPEIAVPRDHARTAGVIVHRPEDFAALRVRRRSGLRVTGVEPTLVALASALDAEAFEIACEDARRRQLTSVTALRTYLDRCPGRPGAAALRHLLDELDPVHASRSPGTVGATPSTSASNAGGRSSRPTAAPGTTMRPITSTTTRSGACRGVTATASCSPPGRRSPAVRASSLRS